MVSPAAVGSKCMGVFICRVITSDLTLGSVSGHMDWLFQSKCISTGVHVVGLVFQNLNTMVLLVLKGSGVVT